MIPAHHLTRHAVCVGMTGSGKTGLCIALLEDLAGSGVPILAIDPKGDLANLALVFPNLAPADFLPWVDPSEAVRLGIEPAELAARTAAAWREGLAAAQLGTEHLAAWRDRVEVIVMTPGSHAGVPVDVVSALTRCPPDLDAEGRTAYVTGAVSALLGLVGRPADPLNDPEAILLARLLGDAFAEGRSLPLDALLGQVVDPPFDRLGYFPLDEVLPPKARTALALALNNVVASPAFAAWRTGVPLDVDAWTAPVAGRTPLRVLYLAHLSDPERMFFVALFLHAVVAWTRRLPGTGHLRALVYLDEVFGFLPPHPKDPPSKVPTLTLMKQARAVGVGVVLATQNPVDLDYKALSNAGTWMIGRLQTENDRARVLEGLRSAGGGVDVPALADRLGGLPARTFVVRNAQGDVTELRSRHTMSYLRGPLTRLELDRVAAPFAPPPQAAHEALTGPPPSSAGLPMSWLRGEVGPRFAPSLWLCLTVRFHPDLHEPDRVVERLLPLDGLSPAAPAALAAQLVHAPVPGTYPLLPTWMDERGEVERAVAAVVDDVARSSTATRWRCPTLRLTSAPGEDEATFTARVAARAARPLPVEPEVHRPPKGEVKVLDQRLLWRSVP